MLPELFLESLHGTCGYDEAAFKEVHASGYQVTSIRVHPAKWGSPAGKSISDEKDYSPVWISGNVPWSKYGHYLGERPSFTFDPLFHAGCYYVQEASSMFLEQALLQTTDLSRPLKVLDLCAAPGGKSTHLQSLISKESLLVSNEVIRSRAHVLTDNIIKWGCENVLVSNNDPSHFSKINGYFDVIVVDAPCSGSGLFRRDPEAIKEWSPGNVTLCSQRQQRILADVWPALKKGGVLIYSTCSYSEDENEMIVEWLMNHYGAESCGLSIEEDWGIVHSGNGYRFWPDKARGEGFFIACVRKDEGRDDIVVSTKRKPVTLTHKESALLEKWITPSGKNFIRHEQDIYAWPGHSVNDFSFLLDQLKIRYSGVLLGQLIRDKFIPGHALAMSGLWSEGIPVVSLDYNDAIRYLQKMDFDCEFATKGWQLVSFMGNPLGWVNALGNRFNNYYPKELRILKDKAPRR